MRTSRRSQVDAFIVMEVVEAASAAEAEGRPVIHMEIGQPATPAPGLARKAVAEALDVTSLGYTGSLGLAELRAAIAKLYHEWYGITLDPRRIIVTSGSSGAFLLAFTALFDSGARVGVTEPGYPSYRQILKALDLVPVGMPTRNEALHRLMPADIPPGLDGAIVASPSNPTGAILNRQHLASLIETCAERGISFVSDEIYHGLHYEERATSALELSDDVYVINSFSKFFSMTGWRVGWMVVPEDHVRTIERLAQNMFICASHAAQVAAVGAIAAGEECRERRAVYAENRALMLDGLPKAGFQLLAPPDGAFFAYVDVSHLTDDSQTLAAEILRDIDVAATPGVDFDPVRGRQTMRFSYAGASDDIREGLRRLSAYMRARFPTQLSRSV